MVSKSMAKPERIIKVRSWSELPETLEPGVYFINGDRIVVRETVSRDALKRTMVIMKRRGGRYV